MYMMKSVPKAKEEGAYIRCNCTMSWK